MANMKTCRDSRMKDSANKNPGSLRSPGKERRAGLADLNRLDLGVHPSELRPGTPSREQTQSGLASSQAILKRSAPNPRPVELLPRERASWHPLLAHPSPFARWLGGKSFWGSLLRSGFSGTSFAQKDVPRAVKLECCACLFLRLRPGFGVCFVLLFGGGRSVRWSERHVWV